MTRRPPQVLMKLRSALAAAAQKVYDEWDEAYAEELSGGGICQDIAGAMVEVLAASGIEAQSYSCSVGEQHVMVHARLDDGVYVIDISPYTYERGGGYSWTKIPDVVFTKDDIVIDKVSDDPSEFDLDFDGAPEEVLDGLGAFAVERPDGGLDHYETCEEAYAGANGRPVLDTSSGSRVKRCRTDRDRDLASLDGRRKKAKDTRTLIEQLEDVTSGHGNESPLDYLHLAREVEPDVDSNDVEAVRFALMAYLQNEYDLAREAEEEKARRGKLDGSGVDPVRETVFEWFKDVVREVWSNGERLVPTLVLSSEEPMAIGNEHPLASLAYASRPTAIGNSLIRYNDRHTLRLSDRLLSMPPEDIRKILVHEAVHMGYPTHGAEFRELVREHGGSVSESAIENDTVKVQKKVGARYQTVREFPGNEERAALQWAKEQQRADPGARWRMLQGLELDATPDEYGMQHRPPDATSGAPLYDLTGDGRIYPDDVYGPDAPRIYGHERGSAMDRETFQIARRVRSNPGAKVTAYRAIPANISDAEINPGDWVTVNRAYAVQHGKRFDEGYKILSKVVRADELYTSGDSIHEFGYWPKCD